MSIDIQLECFFSLAETLNFSETAKHLYISQQAVSKNIAKLESRTGFPLFYRRPHGVQITPWGKEYLELNKKYLRDCRALLEDYQKANNTFKVLTLNQPDFEPVKRMHPFTIPGTDYIANVELSFDTPAYGIERLINRDVDMLVTIDRFVQDTPGIIVKPIFRLEAALLVSKTHPLYEPGVDYRVFKEEAFIAGVDSKNFFETKESIMRDIERFGLEPRSIIIEGDAATALAAAAKGNGFILGSVMAKPPYEHDLATVPTGIINNIVCAWNEHHGKSYSEAFADFLKSEFDAALKITKGKTGS